MSKLFVPVWFSRGRDAHKRKSYVIEPLRQCYQSPHRAVAAVAVFTVTRRGILYSEIGHKVGPRHPAVVACGLRSFVGSWRSGRLHCRTIAENIRASWLRLVLSTVRSGPLTSLHAIRRYTVNNVSGWLWGVIKGARWQQTLCMDF